MTTEVGMVCGGDLLTPTWALRFTVALTSLASTWLQSRRSHPSPRHLLALVGEPLGVESGLFNCPFVPRQLHCRAVISCAQLGREEVFCCAEAVAEATGAATEEVATAEEEVATAEEEVATAEEEVATEAARAEGLPVRVLWLTRGVGADAILSWRSEGWLREGLRALAPSGRFVQMREADAASQETVEGCPNNKVLIQIRPEEKDKAISAPQILNLQALSRFQTVPSASYVIYDI
ncbi:Protein of unknown function [Gryllus bimaculatus]|nr:Protein of unknown function [Gryllus bimaculatus]